MPHVEQPVAKIDAHITQTGLRARGWSTSMINVLLGDPDKTTNNPRHKSAPPCTLYLLDRVLALEKTTEFIDLSLLYQRRKLYADKAVVTKTSFLVAWTINLKLHLPKISSKNLINQAIDTYNDHNSEYGRYASMSCDTEFLNRITVNYLRHAMTRYEDYLYQMRGKTGVTLGYLILKYKVLRLISETYPSLTKECKSQWNQYIPSEDIPLDIEYDLAISKLKVLEL